MCAATAKHAIEKVVSKKIKPSNYEFRAPCKRQGVPLRIGGAATMHRLPDILLDSNTLVVHHDCRNVHAI